MENIDLKYICTVIGNFEITTHIGYFIAPHFNYYGIINAKRYKIVVGPTRQLVHNLL